MLEFLPMLKEDRITKRINRVLKNIKREKLGFNRSYQKIYDEIEQIYNTANIEKMIERKNYLENCMDNPYQIFTTLGLAAISWYVIEIISEMFNSDVIIENIPQYIEYIVPKLGPILCTAILAILIYIFISIGLTRNIRLYMKFNLKDHEMDILNTKLSEELNEVLRESKMGDVHIPAEGEKKNNET